MSKKKQAGTSVRELVATRHPLAVTAWLQPEAKQLLSSYERGGYVAAQIANQGRTPKVAQQRANLLEKSLAEEILRAMRVMLHLEVQRVAWQEDGPAALNRPFPGERYLDWRGLRTVARFESGKRAFGGMFPTMDEHIVGGPRWDEGTISFQDDDGRWIDLDGIRNLTPTPPAEPEVWVSTSTLPPTPSDSPIVFREADFDLEARWSEHAYDGSPTGAEGWTDGDGQLILPDDFAEWRPL